MIVRQQRCLRGPNVWAACPVFELVLEFDSSWSAAQVDQTIQRLVADLDSVGEKPDGMSPPLHGVADAFGRTSLALQGQAGTSVCFHAVRATARPGEWQVAIEFAIESMGQAALELAMNLLLAARDGRPLGVAEGVRRLRDLEYQQRLPASTAVIYNAARARGIPATRLSPEYGRYLRLGHGAKQHRCIASEPDSIGAVARTASTDKYLAKQLMHAAGVPVPVGRLVSAAADAWAAAEELGLPVAMKPQDSDLATGVSLDIRTREGVEAAFRAASEHSPWVIVERFAPGMEHRVLVVADRISAVTRIEPPHVIGDGVSTIAVLVERVNKDPRRGDEASGTPLARLKIDATALEVLAGQGCDLGTIPPKGQRVLVRRNPPYFKNGGNLIDLTDRIHPSIAAHAIAAAQALQLRVAGLDVVAVDIAQPLEDQGGVIVEINAGPGLWLHMAPWADSPRPVGEDIVASMFLPGEDGRVPVVAIVGDSDGTATRHLCAMLSRQGVRAGVARETTIEVGGRRWPVPAGWPQERAALLLQNTAVDVALLVTSPAELLQAGFGNDRCDLAMVIESVPLDPDGSGSFMHALRHALTPTGAWVLPGDGEPTDREASLPAQRAILFGSQADHPCIRVHLAAGGQALTVRGDDPVIASGNGTSQTLGKWPGSGNITERRRLLAALACALALGLDAESLRDYLHSLSSR